MAQWLKEWIGNTETKIYDTLHHSCLLQMQYSNQSPPQLFIASETSFRHLSRIKLQLFIVRASRRPWFQSLIMNNLQHLDQISIWTQEIKVIWGKKKREEKIGNERICISGKWLPMYQNSYSDITILRWRKWSWNWLYSSNTKTKSIYKK